MSEPNSANSSPFASPSSLPADELSKRFFYGGCFGLPWLWIVHVFYWYGKARTNGSVLMALRNEPSDYLPQGESLL